MTKSRKSALDSNSEALLGLGGLARHVATMNVSDFASARERCNWVATTAYDLGRRVDAAVTSGVPSKIIRDAIRPAVEAWCASPFVNRLRTWPRGYPGDFETIEYLCDGMNMAPPDSMAYHFERFFLSTPIIFQHHFKIEAQARRIATACRKRDQASVLILAAGGGRDLLAVADIIKECGTRVVINDIDADALALCRSRFSDFQALQILQGNAFKLTTEFALAGPFDLIVCGGLFDYVPKPFLRRAIPMMIKRLLTEDGALFFTNIAEDSPYRSWLEYFGNWKLIERSEQAIRALIPAEYDGRVDVGVQRDPTGLAYLVDVRKS